MSQQPVHNRQVASATGEQYGSIDISRRVQMRMLQQPIHDSPVTIAAGQLQG
jgi:hypothetical protein